MDSKIYLKGIPKMGESVARWQNVPLFEFSPTLLKGIAEASKSVRAAAAPLEGLQGLCELGDTMRNLQKSLPQFEFPSVLFKEIEETSKRMREAFAPLWKFREQFSILAKNWPTAEERSERDRTSLSLLAEQGWFISMSHTDLADFYQSAALIQRGRIEEANAIMSHHFGEIIEKVEADAIDVSPHRQRVIAKAFASLRARDYEVSIPVMLCQTEGIGLEIFSASVHSKGQTATQTIQKKFDIQERDAFMLSFYGLLTHKGLPIKAETGSIEIERNRLEHFNK
jgi:hypothetical protein